jgi:membrane-associated protein
VTFCLAMADEPAPRPWGLGPPTRADKILLGAIGARFAYNYAMLPAVPWLLAHHPLLMAFLRGTAAPIITLGALARTGHGSLPLAIVAGVPTLMAFDILFFLAGRRWGEGALRMILSRQRRRRRGGDPEQRLARFADLSRRYGAAGLLIAYVGPFPAPAIDAACGWSGMRLRVFLFWDALGILVWTTLLALLGYAIGQRAVDVVAQIAKYSLWLTGGILVAVVVAAVVRHKRR